MFNRPTPPAIADLKPDQPTKESAWRKLVDYILGYQATWITDIGLKAGLFNAISEAGPPGTTEDALAETLGYSPRYTGIWCRAAYAFELLDWDEAAGYRLAPYMESVLLNPTDPLFLGGRVQFNAALHQDFHAFPKYLPSGGVWPRSQHDPWLLEALKNMTKPDYAVITDTVLPQMLDSDRMTSSELDILDLGAGAGYGVVHYASRFPNARVLGIEYDGPSATLAAQTLAESDFGNRAQVLKADANSMNYDSAFDVITMNVTLHEVGGPDSYRNVLSRAHRALRPDGIIIVSELPYPDSPRDYRGNPAYQMMAGVQLHEALVGCGMITQAELRDLLESAGFREVNAPEHPLPTRFILAGRK